MAWGVLEDPVMAKPPGTATIGDNTVPEASKEDRSDLKRDKSGKVILQPQPSDSPNDPLNWSNAWKYSIMGILAFSSGITVSLGPMLTPGLPLISLQYKVSMNMVSSFMIGLLVFWTGFITFFTASGANIWGKRPFFFISTVALFGTCIWGYLATSFPSLAVMRVFQGIASAPLETLVTSTVSDLFFVHQRGQMLSLWGVFLGSGVLLGQIISGFIIQSLGIPSTFGISAIIYGLLLPALYFVVTETTFTPDMRAAVKESQVHEAEKVSSEDASFWLSEFGEVREPYTKRLRLFRGRLSGENFWKGAIKPLPLIAYPAVLFSTIVYGSFFTWLLVISVLSATIFSLPPYNLTPSQVGLTNIPLLIVALIGNPLSGWFADWIVKFMARRNNGVFEPEFRLTLMAIAIPLSTAGFLGFGLSVAASAPLAYPLAFAALHGLAIPFANQASLTYVIDCHPKDANQAFVTINFTKAIFTFLATSYVSGWYQSSGPTGVFVGIACINLAVGMLTIPSYVYGKRLRSMVARSKLAQKLST